MSIAVDFRASNKHWTNLILFSPYNILYWDLNKKWHLWDITWPRVDMNFIFKCSTRYLMSERSEWLRYRVEHEKIKFISISGHVMFCLLYKHTDDNIFDDFRRFSTTFQRFLKIFQNCSEGQTNVSGHFPNIFWRLSKVSEDNWRFPRRAQWCFDHKASHLSNFKEIMYIKLYQWQT